MKPWEDPNTQLLSGYLAKIIGEIGDNYQIEFHELDMSIVEAEIAKSEFQDFPYSLGKGSLFGLVVFLSDNVPKAGVWPLHHYWKLLHKS